MNVPALVGFVVSHGKASLTDLTTVLGVEDLHDLVEIIRTDEFNSQLVRRANEE